MGCWSSLGLGYWRVHRRRMEAAETNRLPGQPFLAARLTVTAMEWSANGSGRSWGIRATYIHTVSYCTVPLQEYSVPIISLHNTAAELVRHTSAEHRADLEPPEESQIPACHIPPFARFSPCWRVKHPSRTPGEGFNAALFDLPAVVMLADSQFPYIPRPVIFPVWALR